MSNVRGAVRDAVDGVVDIAVGAAVSDVVWGDAIDPVRSGAGTVVEDAVGPVSNAVWVAVSVAVDDIMKDLTR